MLFSDFPAGYVLQSTYLSKKRLCLQFSAKYGLYLEPTLAAPYTALPNLKNSQEMFKIMSLPNKL